MKAIHISNVYVVVTHVHVHTKWGIRVNAQADTCAVPFNTEKNSYFSTVIQLYFNWNSTKQL